MSLSKDRGELYFALRALYGWGFSVCILLPLFSIIIWRSSLDSSYIGYISSFISFTAAFFAGVYSVLKNKNSSVFSGLISSLFLIIILLTVGFAIEGENMDSSGIISVSTFTAAGVMLGSNIMLFFSKSKKHSKVKPRK